MIQGSATVACLTTVGLVLPVTTQLGLNGGQLAALAMLAFTQQGWLVFLIMPLFALGGVGTPAGAPGQSGSPASTPCG